MRPLSVYSMGDESSDEMKLFRFLMACVLIKLSNKILKRGVFEAAYIASILNHWSLLSWMKMKTRSNFPR